MRERFDKEQRLGRTPVSKIYINPKSTNALDQLIAALKELYCNEEYSQKIFSIIESYLPDAVRNNGRPGMNLWTVFVLAQVRLCLDAGYSMLHNLANNHRLLRLLIGVDDVFFEEQDTFEYQNIYDNVSRLSDAMLKDINEVIVEFGHREVFKKKETTALRLKTDSFAVESNVHFPTDYNLLWDCARKCLDTMGYFIRKYPHISGWRKIKSWRSEIKGLMREVGRRNGSGGKNKQERLQKAARQYIEKSRMLLCKLMTDNEKLPLSDMRDLSAHYEMERYMKLLWKHIDLVERRIIKGERIPHAEKMMSVFEAYTEWVAKGKFRPSVEFGKKVSITTSQFGLILFYKVMSDEQDKDIVIEIAGKALSKYKNIYSMSCDKGHWRSENKALLELEIPIVVLPKLGKRTAAEEAFERCRIFKHLKNKHSAIESNINELEHRGLDRCPDRGYRHYKAYIAIGVCACNLKKIGKKILEDRLRELLEQKAAKAA